MRWKLDLRDRLRFALERFGDLRDMLLSIFIVIAEDEYIFPAQHFERAIHNRL